MHGVVLMFFKDLLYFFLRKLRVSCISLVIHLQRLSFNDGESAGRDLPQLSQQVRWLEFH
jgi:hypothetical protein